MKRVLYHLMLAAAIATTGCGGEDAGEVEKAVVFPDRLTVFYTCDTRGHLDPCRCTSGIAGGMARRATYLGKDDAYRNGRFLLVDAGNLTAGGRDWELLELDYALKACGQMGCTTVNLGARELAINAGKLKSRRSKFVSCNVVDLDGVPVVSPVVLEKYPSGFTVGILGVVDDSYPVTGEGVQVVPPAEAVGKYLPELAKEAHLIVLLAFMDHEGMAAIAEQFFEIDVIIGGDVPQPTAEPRQVNQSIIVANTDKGKAVGRLDLVFPGGEVAVLSNEISILLDDVPDDPEMAGLIQEFHIERLDKGYPDRREMDEELNAVGAS